MDAHCCHCPLSMVLPDKGHVPVSQLERVTGVQSCRYPHMPCCAEASIAMMIVVAVALLNDRGEVLVAQRRADQSFPGSMPPF